MKRKEIKVMMGLFATVVLGMAGCGGGGGDTAASYDYSKINGKYACYDVLKSFTGYAQMEFLSTNLKYTEVSSSKTYEINDFIGSQNGYPLYTEKVVGSSTESTGVLFSLPGSDGVPAMYLTRGLTEDVQKGIITLNTYTCKKQ